MSLITKEMTKMQIEEFLKNKGDFVQIDHLSRYLLIKDLPVDKKRFVLQKLADLYEKKGMYAESAKMYNNIAIISTTFQEKLAGHVKETEQYIKSGNFDSADQAIKKAMGEGNVAQKAEVFVQIKEFYKRQAQVYEKANKKGNAIKIYEKILQLNITDAERKEIKEKLMKLYESLGKVREYFNVKGNSTIDSQSRDRLRRG